MLLNTSDSFHSEVVFIIEGTAINGAYFNDLKTNYIIPALEHFKQGIGEGESNDSAAIFGAVIYRASDCPPAPPVYSLGPYSAPQKFISALDKLELIGGRGESYASVAEGLATALSCFDEFAAMRGISNNAEISNNENEPSPPTSNANGMSMSNRPCRHALLVASSPPYAMPAQECHPYAGNTAEQLASLLNERGISLSILSPRKIPALFKLFEKAGGDLSASQTKNYAKDLRHLVLLKGFSLKERPLSPIPSLSVSTSTVNLPSPQTSNELQTQPQITSNSLGVSGLPQNQVNTRQINTTQIVPNQINVGSNQLNVNPNQLGLGSNSLPVGVNQMNMTQNQVSVGSNQMNVNSNQIGVVPGQIGVGGNQLTVTSNQMNQLSSGGMIPQNINQIQSQNPNSNMQYRPGQSQVMGMVMNRGLSPHINAGSQPFSQGPPPVYHSTAQQIQSGVRGPRWMGATTSPRTGFPTSSSVSQPSALLSQLSSPPQPPSHPSVPNYMQTHQASQQAQLRMQQMLGVSQQQQQQSQQQQQQQQQQLQQPQQGSQQSIQQPSVTSQQQQGQIVQNTQTSASNTSVTSIPNVGMSVTGGRTFIWQGVLEWMEKGKNPNDPKITHQLPCQVSANCRDGEPELKADSWPPKLIMQLMPKQLIGTIGGSYLKESKSVLFHPQQNEALESLTKVMVGGFAGCVHFTLVSCDVKVLILLYTPDKKAYLGFIPNNQVGFVDKLKRIIQQQKISQINKQGQAAIGPGSSTLQDMPTSQSPASHASIPPSGIGRGNTAGGPINTPAQQQRPQYGNHLEAARQQNLEKILHLQQTLEAAQQQEAQYKSQMEIMNSVRQIQDSLQAAQQQEHHFKQIEAQLIQMSRTNNGSQANSTMNQNPNVMVQNQVSMNANQSSMTQNQASLNQNQVQIGQNQLAMGQNHVNMNTNQINISQNQVNMTQNQVSQNQVNMNQNQVTMGQNSIGMIQGSNQLQGSTAGQQTQLPPGSIGNGPNRAIRPSVSSNPGLRHLLQQQPQYRAGGGLGQRAPTPQQSSQTFDDNSLDFFL